MKLVDKEKIGYQEQQTQIITSKSCLLTIGSIIKFNGVKCLVTHTNISRESPYPYAGRHYKHGHYGWRKTDKKSIDLTLGSSGFLKEIESGYEFRADWGTVTKKNILHFEHLELLSDFNIYSP